MPRPPFNGRGDVGGGLPVLTYLTHPRTAAKPPTVESAAGLFRPYDEL